MSGTYLLLYLIGGAALLLFGVRMVRKGVTSAFGASLRYAIKSSTDSRLRGFVSGMGVTALVQSSTATLLILTAFAGKGVIAVPAALSVALGADVGTTFIAQLLSLDVRWLAPLFLFVGVVGRAWSPKGRYYYLSKALIGLGLMLVALEMIFEATAPLKSSAILSKLLVIISEDWPLLFILTIVITAVSHSSLAIVLLIMSLAANQLLAMDAALIAVLGANVGGAIPPFLLNLKDGGYGRMVAFGTLLMRFIGAVFVLIILDFVMQYAGWLGERPARQVVNFHTGFNLVRAILFLPFVGIIGRWLMKVMSVEEGETVRSQPKYLDEQAVDMPPVAMALARREVLRMGDMVQNMLSTVINLFYGEKRHLIYEIRDDDDAVDDLYDRIKLYLSKLSEHEMDEEQSLNCQNILIFATNLEHIGDVIDKNLNELGRKRIDEGIALSDEGLQEIIDFHGQVMVNMRLAMNLFMTDDSDLAKALLENNRAITAAANETTKHHFDRMRQGLNKTLQSSSLHLDIVRDLHQINNHLTRYAQALLHDSQQLFHRNKRSFKDLE